MGVSFRTKVNIKQSDFDINYQTPALMIGSCFSDNIGVQLNRLKFPVLLNPFGVLYNPSSISQALKVAIHNHEICKDDLIQHNNLWHSFLFHGSFSNENKDRVIELANKTINKTHDFLKNAKYLFVTFGTAWVYENKQNQSIVSNCHKIPASNFNRFRLNVSEISNDWTELIIQLKEFNPKLNIIFTISPVRHLKDGIHENQLSKSTLFLSLESIVNSINSNHLEYFPSYEIIHDELRDYRFYKDDMIHISEKAIEYIFERFKGCYFNNTTKSLTEKINAICLAFNHRILKDNKKEIQNFAATMIEKIELIEKEHPYVKLSLEKEYFENL